MRSTELALLLSCLFSLLTATSLHALHGSVKVFEEPGFPTADTSALSVSEMSTLFSGVTAVIIPARAGLLLNHV